MEAFDPAAGVDYAAVNAVIVDQPELRALRRPAQ